jgi:hypothetical protein
MRKHRVRFFSTPIVMLVAALVTGEVSGASPKAKTNLPRTVATIQLNSAHGKKTLAIVHDSKANSFFVERNSGKLKRSKIKPEIAQKIESDALNLLWTNEVERKSSGRCNDSAGSIEVTGSKESAVFCRSDISLAAQLQEFGLRVEKLVN